MKEIQNFFRIDSKTVFTPQNPLIIAELGTSHNSDINKAKEMVDAAGSAGALCVKFQMVYADEILHPNTGFVELPGGKIRLYDRFKALELPLEFYAEIKEYTESKGLLFLCTPFGLKSASILKELQPKMVKIASPELNFTSLIEEIFSWNIPTLLSTGVSRLKDIDSAILCASASLREGICLLHCVTSYPAPETDYNLRLLPSLANIFGVSVGVSDHSLDPELIPALAVSMGACVIEKHFCLSRSDPGLDDPIALPPEDFTKMVSAVRYVNEQLAMSNDQLTPVTSLQPPVHNSIIDHYKKERGGELINNILGSGIKELAPSEKANYNYTNRSVHALRNLKAGDVLKPEDYAVLRTEKNLRPGLEPCWEKLIKGRTVKNDIPAGEGIRFIDI